MYSSTCTKCRIKWCTIYILVCTYFVSTISADYVDHQRICAIAFPCSTFCLLVSICFIHDSTCVCVCVCVCGCVCVCVCKQGLHKKKSWRKFKMFSVVLGVWN